MSILNSNPVKLPNFTGSLISLTLDNYYLDPNFERAVIKFILKNSRTLSFLKKSEYPRLFSNFPPFPALRILELVRSKEDISKIAEKYPGVGFQKFKRE